MVSFEGKRIKMIDDTPNSKYIVLVDTAGAPLCITGYTSLVKADGHGYVFR